MQYTTLKYILKFVGSEYLYFLMVFLEEKKLAYFNSAVVWNIKANSIPSNVMEIEH